MMFTISPNLIKNKLQIQQKINYPNTGGSLLQNWVINCSEKNSNGKVQNFIESTKTSSPTSHSGATSLPPIGIFYIYIYMYIDR